MAFDEPTLGEQGGSISEFIKGYRAELVVPPDVRMAELSTVFLQPNIDAMIGDLNDLRVKTDGHFLQVRDQMQRGEVPLNAELLNKLKTYPISCCLEITRYMLMLMSAYPAPTSAKGLNALHNFCRAGGQVKRIWGGLRNTYFQNAIQAGTYYVDVANDTVDPNKPKVEIKLISESGFSNLDTYHDYANIGEIYWNCRMVPNWFFPNLAPFFPIITINEVGALRFDSRNVFMFPRNIESKFALAKDFLTHERHADYVHKQLLPDLVSRMTKITAVDATHGLFFAPERNLDQLNVSLSYCAALTGRELEAAVQMALGFDRPPCFA